MNQLPLQLRSVCGNQLCCNAGDVDPVGNTAALHARGDIHCVAKQAVSGVGRADHRSHYRARVEASSDAQVPAQHMQTLAYRDSIGFGDAQD